MRPRKNRLLQRLSAAVAILLLAQLACDGGVQPDDPRVYESLNSMVEQFMPWFEDMQFSQTGKPQPPMIMKVEAGTVTGLASTGASSRTIRLYLLELQGCENPARQRQVAETTNASSDWSIPYAARPGQVLAATQVIDGKESGLSNPVTLEAAEALVLDRAEELQDIVRAFPEPVRVSGSALPGSCLVLMNRDSQYGREQSLSVPADRAWHMDLPARNGKSTFRLYMEGWEHAGRDISLTVNPPRMSWPYPVRDMNGTDCRYRGDENHVSGCYYAGRLNAWYGHNDFYIAKKPFNNDFHNGLDIASGEGTNNLDIYPVAEGEVFYIQLSSNNGGNFVLIDHGTWVSGYFHLKQVKIEGFATPSHTGLVDPPRHVTTADRIGLMGESGCQGCGVHLHFSVFTWARGDRASSLKKNGPRIPWLEDDSGYPLQHVNINPPDQVTLGNGKSSHDRLADRRDPNQPLEYFSLYDYWDVNWMQIRLRKYDGCPDGTLFNELVGGKCP